MSDHLPDLECSYETLRILVCEVLAKMGDGSFVNLNSRVADRAVSSGIANMPIDTDNSRRYGERVHHKPGSFAFLLSDRDLGRVHDIMWYMVIEGLVRPGLGNGKSVLSFPTSMLLTWESPNRFLRKIKDGD